jgi:hypothetical protein
VLEALVKKWTAWGSNDGDKDEDEDMADDDDETRERKLLEM